MSEDKDRQEMFLKLREKVDNVFKEYMNAMAAFNDSNLDVGRKKIMDEMHDEYMNTLIEFQTHFPKGKV